MLQMEQIKLKTWQWRSAQFKLIITRGYRSSEVHGDNISPLNVQQTFSLANGVCVLTATFKREGKIQHAFINVSYGKMYGFRKANTREQRDVLLYAPSMATQYNSRCQGAPGTRESRCSPQYSSTPSTLSLLWPIQYNQPSQPLHDFLCLDARWFHGHFKMICEFLVGEICILFWKSCTAAFETLLSTS
jgi:hypothetical protein